MTLRFGHAPPRPSTLRSSLPVFAPALLALALSACDPIGAAGAVFVDPAGAPVAGAKVHFTCPANSGADGAEATSDATGKFTYERIPSIPATCTMTVEKAGFKTKTLTMKDVLYQSGMFDAKTTLPKVKLDPAP